LILLFSRFC